MNGYPAPSDRPFPCQAGELIVFHAGSLSRVMGEIAEAFTAETAVPVRRVASGSGSLRLRIEQGERPDLFASADMGSPRTLENLGLAHPPVVFARNTQCLLARKGLDLTRATLIERLLDPGIRIGTSTPGLDPGGDYAWELFDRIGAIRAGAAERLKAKARRLVGDPALPLPPEDYARHQVLWHLETGRADVFPVYRTTALLAARQAAWVEVIELPPALAVQAEYGVSLMAWARYEATQLLAFILGPDGQARLRACGFAPP